MFQVTNPAGKVFYLNVKKVRATHGIDDKLKRQLTAQARRKSGNPSANVVRLTVTRDEYYFSTQQINAVDMPDDMKVEGFRKNGMPILSIDRSKQKPVPIQVEA